MKTSKRALHSQRGSALIVALLLTIGLAVMLASYHSLIHFNLRSSHRSYHSSAAMNLAETGLEEGMYAINKKRANPSYTYASEGWTIVGTTATREFSNTFAVGTASETYVKVQINNYDLLPGSRPTIKTQARLTLPNGMPAVTKWVEVTLDAPAIGIPGQQGPTHPGLVAKQTIKFNGTNPTVDSWNSDPLNRGAMTHRYDSTTKNDQGFVGSIDVAVDQVNIQNADIKGYVATNSDTDLSNNVGPRGSILADDSPAGTKIDPTRVSTDFTAAIPAVEGPTGVTYNPLPASLNLPNRTVVPYDTPSADGKYYYSPGDINLSGNATMLSITSGDVVIVANNISITGNNSGIAITTGASLDIYVSGDVRIAGNGIANGGITSEQTQQPSKFKLWGTKTGDVPQNFNIAGRGELSGVIYAPNANVAIVGNGDIMGSVVAKNITISGEANFHYDESLGQFAFGTPSDTGETALTIYRWRELLAASETTW